MVMERYKGIAQILKTKRGKKYAKIFAVILSVSVVLFISLNITNRRYEKDIEELKTKIEFESQKKNIQNIKEEYQRYKEFLNLWEVSKIQNESIYEFFVLLSNSVSNSIQIDKIEIYPQDENSLIFSFIIYGIAKDSSNVKTFASKLNKKRGDIVSFSEILELLKSDENKFFKFKINGKFHLNTKKVRKK